MSITALSKELKKIRIDAEVTRAQMAKALRVTDKMLEGIESGKLDLSDELVRMVVSVYYGVASEVEQNSIYLKLKLAQSASVSAVTFNMSNLTAEQRQQVIILKDLIDAQNKEIRDAAALEVKRIKEERAASRKAVEVKPKVAVEILDIEDLNDVEDAAVEHLISLQEVA